MGKMVSALGSPGEAADPKDKALGSSPLSPYVGYFMSVTHGSCLRCWLGWDGAWHGRKSQSLSVEGCRIPFA